jgi:hypothetical protein
MQEAAMDWGHLLETISKLLTDLAIIFGGGWVLYNYLTGRTHKSRVQLRISGERTFRDGHEYLLVKTELYNVGLARVELVSDGCATTVYAHDLPKVPKSIMEPRWEKLPAFDLFRGQRWVEPSGLLTDQQLIAIPGVSSKFLRVWAHVESEKVAWNAEAVIAPLPK